MIDITFLSGVVGGIVLVLGSAWPSKPIKYPVKSAKNWLFTMGWLFMLTYSILNYMAGGPIFFVLLQGLVGVATVLMMLNAPDNVDIPVIAVAALGLTVWSLTMFEGYQTVFFVIGLSGVALGYALEPDTVRRNLALALGAALIALFSYIVVDWIFFWLNVFFALFSGYYAWKLGMRKSARA